MLTIIASTGRKFLEHVDEIVQGSLPLEKLKDCFEDAYAARTYILNKFYQERVLVGYLTIVLNLQQNVV